MMSAPAPPSTSGRPSASASGIAALLLAAYVVAFAQRQLPATLAELIARRFALSNAEMGGLIGYGFALCYAALGVPAGWLADRARRLRLLAFGLALASAATATSAVASDAATLTAMRLLVGVGQSALVPVAYSLLGDLLPRDRIGRAAACFAVGPFIGAGLMLILGGRLASGGGWRLPFVIAGAAGLCLAAAILSVREPTRHPSEQRAVTVENAATYFARHWRSVAAVDGALTFVAMAGHMVLAWGVTWLMRNQDMSLADATLGLGVAVIGGGVAGTLAAGSSGDALLRRWPGMPRLALLSGAALIAALIARPIFTTAMPLLALAGLPLITALIAAALAIGPAALQDITPPGLRGRQHGLAILLINIVGLGLGPLIVGIASDAAGDAGALGRVLGFAVPLMLGAAAVIAGLGARAQGRSAAVMVQATATARRSTPRRCADTSSRTYPAWPLSR